MRRFASLVAVLFGLTSAAASAAIRMGSPTFDVVEANTLARISVVLTAQDSASGPVTVNYRTVAGTASPVGAGQGDYVTTAGTLVWDQGDFEAKVIEVQILDDDLAEGTESFYVELDDPVGSTLTAPSITEVFIVDNESPSAGSVQFVFTDYQVTEGGTESLANCPVLTAPNNACLPVRRFGGAAGAVSVEVTRVSGGTATPGADFADAAQLFTWGDGDVTLRYFQFQVIDDAIAEPPETIFYDLFNATGGLSIDSTRARAIVTIIDNDSQAAQPGALQFGITSYSIAEGSVDAAGCPTLIEPNNACLPVQRIDGSAGAVTVVVERTGGTASPGVDFTATPQQLNWADGDASTKYYQFRVIDDSAIEADETIFFQLQTPTGGATLVPARTTATVTIIDNDGTGPGRVQFGVTDYLIFEGQTESAANCPSLTPPNNACLPVRRLGGATGAVSVEVARVPGGTASPGVDFVDSLQVLSWPDGDSATRYFQFEVIDDSVVESTETIIYELQNATGGVTIDSTRNRATVSIGDNDSEGPGAISFVQTSGQVFESEGSISMLVARTGGTAGFASVEYVTRLTSPPSAGFGDFTATRGTLIFQAGTNAPQLITVPIIDNTRVDGTRRFEVALSDPTGAVLGTNTVFTVFILDDDDGAATSRFSLNADRYEVNASAGVLRVNVRRNNTASSASVRLRTADGSGRAGEAYVAVDRVINFAAGEDTRPVDIALIADSSGTRGDVTFLVVLEDPSNGTLGLPDSAVVTVKSTASSSQSDTVSFVANNIQVDDSGGAAVVQVRRTGAGRGAATVQYQTLDGTAIAGSDYTSRTGALSWTDGDTSTRSISIPIIPPQAAGEGPEFFTVQLSEPVGLRFSGSNAATVTIVPVGADAVVGFASPSVTLSQTAARSDVVLRRQGNSSRPLTVRVSSVDLSAQAGVDYLAIDEEITWQANEGGDKVLPVRALYRAELRNPVDLELRLELVDGIVRVGTSRLAVQILPQEPAVVRFGATKAVVRDREGRASLIVERSNPASPAAVRVRTVSGSAREGEHFQPYDEFLIWAAGDAAPKLVLVQLIPSTEPTPTLSFSVSLTPSEGSALTQVDGAASFATVEMKSVAAEESRGIGGCSTGRADGITLPAMLLLSLGWLALRRRLRTCAHNAS